MDKLKALRVWLRRQSWFFGIQFTVTGLIGLEYKDPEAMILAGLILSGLAAVAFAIPYILAGISYAPFVILPILPALIAIVNDAPQALIGSAVLIGVLVSTIRSRRNRKLPLERQNDPV